ncbi:MAG: hypothetical protein Q8Q18_00180 [bacterium]|nr:hypothetical protein [bacterium]
MEASITIGFVETLVFLGATVLSVGIAYGTLKREVTDLKESSIRDIRPDLKAFSERLPQVEERLRNVAGQMTDIEQSLHGTRSRFGDMERMVGGIRATVDQLNTRVQHVDELVQTGNTRLTRVEEQGIALNKNITKVEIGIAVIDSIRERLRGVEGRFEVFWRDRYAQASSPRQLNEYGSLVLVESGIKDYIDEYEDELSEEIEEADPQNPYDAEQLIVDSVRFLPRRHPEILNDLKRGAFKTGADLDGVLYVGALYLRNKLLPELGFSLSEFDDDLNTQALLPMHMPKQDIL